MTGHLMDQHGLTRADMVPILGSPSRVSEDDETETRPWHYFLIEMLIDVLPGMVVRS
jgi:hypothetical protein